jgi:hypothetical protein
MTSGRSTSRSTYDPLHRRAVQHPLGERPKPTGRMSESSTLALLLESRTLKDAKRVVSRLVGMGFVWLPLGGICDAS